MYVCKKYLSLLRQVTFFLYIVGVAADSAVWTCDSREDGIFECLNGINCIPNEWVCNGLDNCPDGSDEEYCSGGFICPNDNRWIPDSLVCNGFANCEGGADEDGCICPQYACSSGACYSSAQLCDKINDCGDWSDEPITCDCPTIEFTCESGYSDFTYKCLAAEKVCDGVSDCLDGSDEYASRCSASCQANETRCSTGVSNFNFWPCIDNTDLCDDYADCVDHSDETGCSGCSETCVSSTETYNGYLLKYICADFKQCDYTTDCLDGSDEESSCNCFIGVECRVTDRCVPYDARCDGENQCGDPTDWTDDCFCSDYGDYQTQYCGNTGRCLAPWQLCDGVDDCGDGSDEVFCPSAVTDCRYFSEPKYPCETFTGKDDRCIDMDLVCNGYGDCSDGSDETICNQSCPNGKIRCATGTSTLSGRPVCISESMWCDGTAQCFDHSDENYLMCQDGCSPENNIERWWCQSIASNDTYSCLSATDFCDGLYYCPGHEYGDLCCDSDEYSCLSESSCQPSYYICDGYDDCDGGDDEASCSPCANSSWFECDNGRCISFSQYCDGKNDCVDNSDEPLECRPYNNCSSSQYSCLSGECLLLTYKCDGIRDCEDGSDEDNGCDSNPPKRINAGVIVGAIVGGVVVVTVIVAVLTYKFVCVNLSANARTQPLTRKPAPKPKKPQNSQQPPAQNYPLTQFQASQHQPFGYPPPQAYQYPAPGYHQGFATVGMSEVHPSQQLPPSMPPHNHGYPSMQPNLIYKNPHQPEEVAPQPVFPAQPPQHGSLPPPHENGPSSSDVKADPMPTVSQ